MTDWFFPALLYGLLIGVSVPLESALCTFFFLVTYYFFTCSENKYRYFIAGAAFFLAIMSKMTVIFPATFLLLWYAYKKLISFNSQKNILIELSQIKPLLLTYFKFFVPFLGGALLLRLRYKYAFVYVWEVYKYQEHVLSFADTVRALLFNHWLSSSFYLLLIAIGISTYLFLKEKKFYALVSGPLLLCTIFLLSKALGGGLLSFHYYAPLFPFLILTLLRLRQLWTSPPLHQLLQVVFILFLVFPGLYTSPFNMKNDLGYANDLNVLRFSAPWKEMGSFVQTLHYGFSVIPKQEGRILIEMDPWELKRMKKTIGLNLPNDQIDLLDRTVAESYPDWGTLEGFKFLLGEDFSYNASEIVLTEKEKEILANLESGVYSLIFYGPPESRITDRIWGQINTSNPVLNSYCTVRVPSSFWLEKVSGHQNFLFFKKFEDCQEMIISLASYYTQEYPSLCSLDKSSADVISQVLLLNGFDINQTCEEGGNAQSYFRSKQGIRKLELKVMLFFVFIPFIILFLKKQRFISFKN